MSDRFKPSENALVNQRAMLLAHLREHGEISTVTCREEYGVMSPAARIMELRRTGHAIVTKRCVAYDFAGVPHRSAVYILGGGA